MKDNQRNYYMDGLMSPRYQNYKLRSDIVQDNAVAAGNHAYERGMVSDDAKSEKRGLFARLFSKKKK